MIQRNSKARTWPGHGGGVPVPDVAGDAFVFEPGILGTMPEPLRRRALQPDLGRPSSARPGAANPFNGAAMFKTIPGWIHASLAMALLAGCATGSEQATRRAAEHRAAASCVRLPAMEGLPSQALVDPATPRASVPAIAGFSQKSVETARDIGVLPLLARYAALAGSVETRSDAEGLAWLSARQRLADRVLLSLLDVQGIVAELECERDRGERLEFILAQAQARRDRRLALSGLIVGALTTMASGGLAIGLPESNRADVVGILGGATEAGIGAAGLTGNASAALRTGRNLLREVWEAPAVPRLLPPIVWRLLTAPSGVDASGPSIRDELVARWRDDAAVGGSDTPERRRRVELFFGAGGQYSPEDLQARELMLDSLQARVWLMSLELERLLREVIGRVDRGS